jgi:hypothetical protein
MGTKRRSINVCPSTVKIRPGRRTKRASTSEPTPSSGVWVVVRAAGTTNQPAAPFTIFCAASVVRHAVLHNIVSPTTIMSRRFLLVSAAAVVGTGTRSNAFAPSAAAAFASTNKRARTNIGGRVGTTAPTRLSMVLEKPVQKKLAKIEELKVASDHLVHPLLEVRCQSVIATASASAQRCMLHRTCCRSEGIGSSAPPSPLFCFMLPPSLLPV